MKFFFVKIIVFIVIGYVGILSAYNYLVTGNGEKYLVKKFLRNKEEIEAVAIGTSHVWTINFKSIGINGISFGVGGRDLTECKYILEFLLSQKGQNIRRVFISISYFTLYQDNNLANNGLSDVRSYMYNTIPSNRILENDVKNYIMGKFLPFIQSNHWRFIVIQKYNQFRHSMNRKTSEAAFNKKQKKAKAAKIPEKIIEARVNEQIAIHARAKKNSEYDTKLLNIKLIHQIAEIGEKNKIQIIFFTPPYHYKYIARYDSKYIQELKYVMEKVVKTNSVIYLDFSEDPEFIYNDLYFYDPDHINSDAKEILGKKIKCIIDEETCKYKPSIVMVGE